MIQKRNRAEQLSVTVFQILLFFILIFLIPFKAAALNSGIAIVEKTIDGDTIQVRYKSKSLKVRLWGIDTPEYHQAYSKAAKKFTAKLVDGLAVHLQVKDWDDYGRMVAIVTLADNRCLNEELLKKGLAWVHIYYCKDTICDSWNDYEKKARQKQIGLWRDPSPVPPWVWKRKNKHDY
jgi:endonuclease YncB( thermonuclease family)